MAIAVFLLDDHEVVRCGIREVLEAEDDLHLVGEAGTTEESTARRPAESVIAGPAGDAPRMLEGRHPHH